jgi:hypothetical protein
MRRKPPHPDAEGIADDGGDENGEHQGPAAKVMIKLHRISTVCGQQRPIRKRPDRERRTRALPLVFEVAYDGFAYMGNKAVERPVFFLASVELASRSGIVALIRLPQRRSVYFRDSDWSSLSSKGPSSLATRSVVSLPHLVH